MASFTTSKDHRKALVVSQSKICADSNDTLVGLRVAKRFNKQLYFGKITEILSGTKYKFHVEYDDGDAEDMDKNEFYECRNLYTQEKIKKKKKKSHHNIVIKKEENPDSSGNMPNEKVIQAEGLPHNKEVSVILQKENEKVIDFFICKGSKKYSVLPSDDDVISKHYDLKKTICAAGEPIAILKPKFTTPDSHNVEGKVRFSVTPIFRYKKLLISAALEKDKLIDVLISKGYLCRVVFPVEIEQLPTVEAEPCANGCSSQTKPHCPGVMDKKKILRRKGNQGNPPWTKNEELVLYEECRKNVHCDWNAIAAVVNTVESAPRSPGACQLRYWLYTVAKERNVGETGKSLPDKAKSSPSTKISRKRNFEKVGAKSLKENITSQTIDSTRTREGKKLKSSTHRYIEADNSASIAKRGVTRKRDRMNSIDKSGMAKKKVAYGSGSTKSGQENKLKSRKDSLLEASRSTNGVTNSTADSQTIDSTRTREGKKLKSSTHRYIEADNSASIAKRGVTRKRDRMNSIDKSGMAKKKVAYGSGSTKSGQENKLKSRKDSLLEASRSTNGVTNSTADSQTIDSTRTREGKKLRSSTHRYIEADNSASNAKRGVSRKRDCMNSIDKSGMSKKKVAYGSQTIDSTRTREGKKLRSSTHRYIEADNSASNAKRGVSRKRDCMNSIDKSGMSKKKVAYGSGSTKSGQENKLKSRKDSLLEASTSTNGVTNSTAESDYSTKPTRVNINQRAGSSIASWLFGGRFGWNPHSRGIS
eukprot:CAMPEP_0172434484 /NCGR_PEP_ID=MMETSP1064-20121228/70660_1 /TAXON_ID=202472 /ORGANISM="Aulacoseira subarctica , Strain CCAP 1002/5" /LENGTH=758 /DNA_ID=CAMNT_0013182713 /DNA_START=82 /DNA_END=2359 /DNA_ORIENTATION=-